MKKFNQMTERQMSKANGGILPFVVLVYVGTVGGLFVGSTITASAVAGTQIPRAKG